MKLIIYILLWISFFTSCYCTDFNQLKNLLESNSKELEMKQISVAISKKDLDIIESENYPSISLGANLEDAKSLTNSSGSASVGDNNLITDSAKKSYSYLGLNYNVYSFGRLETKSNSQKHQIEVAKYDYCQQKNDLNLKLLELYSNALNYQLRIETFENILEERNRIYELKERLFIVGNVGKLDVTKSAIDIADIYGQISEFKKELKNNEEQISFLTGYVFKRNEYLDSLMIDNSMQNIEFENSSTSKVIFSQMEAKKFEVLLFEKEFLPNLNFYSKYDFYGNDINSYKTSIEELKENSYRFGLNLTISLFDGFKTTSQKEKALLELKQLQTKYDLEKARFENEISISNQNFQMDKSNLENRLQNIQLTSLNQTNTTKLENIGEMARIETINSNMEKMNKELDYKLNEVKLAYEFNKRKILIEDEKCIVH